MISNSANTDSLTIEFQDGAMKIDTSVVIKSNDAGVLLALLRDVSKASTFCYEAVANFEVNYRQWRSLSINELLAKEPKLAEWKVTARINATPEYERHKSNISEWSSMFYLLNDVRSAIILKLSTLSHAPSGITTELFQQKLGSSPTDKRQN